MTRSRKQKNSNKERSVYQTLIYPDLSEKNTLLAEKSNTYVFVVAPDATKPEIRKAVEEIFNVRVENVNTLVRKGKLKSSTYGIYSKKKDTKRAFVTLHEEDSIDLL